MLPSIGLIIILIAAFTGAAHAQELRGPLADWSPPYPDVPGIPRPNAAEVPVQPVPAQSVPTPATPFSFQAALTVGTFFDDNVYATHANRQSDWAVFARPELGWTLRGENFALETRGFIDARRYKELDSEDQTGGGFSVNGVYQPNKDTQLQGRLQYIRAYESRGSGESVLQQFDRPLGYDVYEAAGQMNRRYGNFWTSTGGAAQLVHYGTPTIGGVEVDQSYRDGTIGFLSHRMGAAFAPSSSVFLEVAANRRNFEVNDFDSDGYRIAGGLLFEPGNRFRLRGEIYAGYMYQNYVGATFDTISTWTFGGSLTYQFTPQVAGTLLGRREAKESGLNNGVSLIETLAGGRLDYLLNPRLTFGVGATYVAQEFIGANRTDSSISPLVALKYDVSKNVVLAFDYRYLGYDSTAAGTSTFFKNVYLLSLNGRM